MPRFSTNLLYGLSATLVGLLALWIPVPGLVAIGLALGAVVHLLRARQDKSAAALRTARRPLVDALWAHSGPTAGNERLTDAIAALLEQEGVADALAVAEFDPVTDHIRGYVAHPEGTAAIEMQAGCAEGLLGDALRSGRPSSSDELAGPVAQLEAPWVEPTGLPGNDGWVALPLLDPAPVAACVDEGYLHQSDCPARDSAAAPSAGSWRGACEGCAHDPLRGVVAVHVLETAPREGLADFLESLARTLGTIFSLRRLGDRLEIVEAGREQLLDAMLNGLLSTDQEGRIRYQNRRARELFAGTVAMGRRLDEFVSLPAGSTALTRALMEGRATLRAEGLLHREATDGGPASLPVRVNLTPVRVPDGSIRGAVCVLEDRSHVLALENEIRHLDTLAALGRFASGLVHEIRNPMGGIQAGVEYLDQSGEFSGETREHLAVIQGEVRRVDSILTDLLQVARPRELVATPVNPVTLGRSVLDGFRPFAQTVRVNLELHAPDPDETIHADEQMIRQVLVNLIKNAIEASPANGTVELRIISAAPADASRARAGFVVNDRGPGITDEDLPRLFEPFFTRKGQGTGLGLYVSHGFVERHGGRLRVENRPGGGASFRVDLPRVTALVGG
jgi:two-component system nitrogen regulation sensor histidine kinase GlnL